MVLHIRQILYLARLTSDLFSCFVLTAGMESTHIKSLIGLRGTTCGLHNKCLLKGWRGKIRLQRSFECLTLRDMVEA